MKNYKYITECSHCGKNIKTPCNWFNNFFIYYYHILKCIFHIKISHNKIALKINPIVVCKNIFSLMFYFVLACIMFLVRLILFPFYNLYKFLFEFEDELLN